MAKLLIVESDERLCEIFNELLEYSDFDYEIVHTYEKARSLLRTRRYEFAVTDLNLSDSKDGRIISLFNRHNVAPIIFTTEIDEDFLEAYESAKIADYFLKEGEKSLPLVVSKLNQLKSNKQVTLLVVDDSILYANFIKQNLVIHKFKVLTAPNGEVALQRLKNHPEVQLVITNHRMKRMDGIELTQKIRETKDKKELPILALSTLSDADTTSLFLQAGANDYLPKPFIRDELYEKIYENLPTY